LFLPFNLDLLVLVCFARKGAFPRDLEEKETKRKEESKVKGEKLSLEPKMHPPSHLPQITLEKFFTKDPFASENKKEDPFEPDSPISEIEENMKKHVEEYERFLRDRGITITIDLLTGRILSQSSPPRLVPPFFFSWLIKTTSG